MVQTTLTYYYGTKCRIRVYIIWYSYSALYTRSEYINQFGQSCPTAKIEAHRTHVFSGNLSEFKYLVIVHVHRIFVVAIQIGASGLVSEKHTFFFIDSRILNGYSRLYSNFQLALTNAVSLFSIARKFEYLAITRNIIHTYNLRQLEVLERY